MDRRSIQVRTANCIHTKSIFSLLDLSHAEESYKKIKNHVDNCSVCEAEFKKFQLESLAVKIHIPKPIIDSELKETFEREISEIFKAFDLNQKALTRKKIKEKMSSLDSFGVGVIKNLTSKTMLKSYALAAVLVIALKQFFN